MFKVIGIILILISIYLLTGVVKDVYSMIELKQRSEVASQELEKLKAENAELISQKNKLEDDDYVQSYARGNYMFSKDGEQIFYLPSDGDEIINDDIPTGRSSEKSDESDTESNAQNDAADSETAENE